MTLTTNDCYLSTSHNDRRELLELIYKHKPELLRNTATYIERDINKYSHEYPYIKLDCNRTLTGMNFPSDNILSREEFLNKLDIKEGTQNHEIRIKFKFI